MLVRVDPAYLLEASRPGGARHEEILVIAVSLERREQLSVYKVHPDLADSGVTGYHSGDSRALFK